VPPIGEGPDQAQGHPDHQFEIAIGAQWQKPGGGGFEQPFIAKRTLFALDVAEGLEARSREPASAAFRRWQRAVGSAR
jgi:hypothetical protein